MKQEVMDVVRGTGRFGLLASVILSAGSYILMIMLIALAIIINKVPQEMAYVTVDGSVAVQLDKSATGLDEESIALLDKYLTEGADGGAVLSFGRFNLPLNSYDSANGEGVFSNTLSKFAVKDLSMVLIYIIIYLAVCAVMFAMNGFFAKSLKDCKSPLSETVMKPLGNFAFMLVIWSFVRAAVYAIVGGFFTGKISLTSSEIVVIAMAVLFYMVVRFVKASARLAED